MGVGGNKMSPDAPAKKPVEAVMAYLRGQGLTRVQQLAEIKQ